MSGGQIIAVVLVVLIAGTAIAAKFIARGMGDDAEEWQLTAQDEGDADQ